MSEAKKNILDKIKSGELKMRPRSYFVLQAALITAGTIILFLVSVFFVSFIFYIFRSSHIALLPRFGGKGFGIFFAVFPWIPVLVALIITGIISLILHRYAFAYKRPLLFLPVAIIALITLGGLLFHVFSFHDRFGPYSMRRNVPVFGKFYRQFGRPERGNLTFGTVISIAGNTWQVQSEFGQNVTVHISPQTEMPQNNIAVGEKVMIFGSRTDLDINADSVRRIPPGTPANFVPRSGAGNGAVFRSNPGQSFY